MGWLRAVALGANGGIVGTPSLIVGVAASAATRSAVLIAALAGPVAGTMSVAAGADVSISSRSDTEHAGPARERADLRDSAEAE
jgi:vacuolar iron transporter family protein